RLAHRCAGPTALECPAGTEALGMVAPKTVVAPIHLFEPIDEPRRCQRVGPQPTTREGKRADIHRGDTGHRRHPDQRTPPGERGPIQPPIRCTIGAVAGLRVRLVPIAGLIAALHSQPFPSALAQPILTPWRFTYRGRSPGTP